jgi:hypothetical protein
MLFIFNLVNLVNPVKKFPNLTRYLGAARINMHAHNRPEVEASAGRGLLETAGGPFDHGGLGIAGAGVDD